jgi:signal transduction histidine kinase
MTNFLELLFGAEGFIPHGHCFLWQPGILWTTVTSDFLIFCSYVAISGGLWYFVRKRRDIEFKALFVLFGTFILACGTTHLLDVITVWYPAYWAAGGIKTITAIASVLTAIMLFPLIPQALALPSPSQLRVANAELAELSVHLQTAREDEKGAIARELHDELGSLLTALGMDLRNIQNRLKAQGNNAAYELGSAIELLNSAVDVKRRVMEDLHPTVLEQFGLAPALRWLAENFAKRSGLQYSLVLVEDIKLGKEQSIDLFRVAQESLTNISRHAHASAFSIRLESDSTDLKLQVTDNGRGANPEAFNRPMSHGVRGMRQRMARWNGTLQLRNADGGGVRVFATIPLHVKNIGEFTS